MKRNGFSLIEVLIVLGIIGTLAVFSVSRPKSSQKDFNRFYRRFSLLSKKIRNQALLENATYRMVIYLESDVPHQIWVEKSNDKILIGDEKQSREEFKKILKDFQDKKSEKKDKKAPKKPFKKSSRFDFQKLKMPTNLIIKQVEISGIDYEINEGVAVFYYFPHGLVEETAIQFKDIAETHAVTLITEGISGEIFKINGHQTLKNLQERR